MVNTIVVFLRKITEKGFFHLLLSNILIALSLFGSQILVAKWISPTELGLIKSWQTYISILSVFAGLGLSSAVLKISANKDKTNISVYFFTSLIVLVTGSLIVLFGFLLLLNLNIFTDSQELIGYLNRYSFIVVLTAINALFLAHYTGQRKIKEVSKINLFYRLISVTLIILFTYYFGISGFFFALICGVSLTLIVYLFLNREELNFRFFNFSLLKKYPTIDYSFNGGILCNGVSQLALGLDLILLNYFSVDGDVIGYYSFALLIVMGLSMFTSTIMQIVMPYVTLYEHDLQVLYKRYFYYQKIAILAYGTIFVIALLLTPIIMDWIFLGKYVVSEQFYLPLFLFWLIKSFSAMPIALFSGVGKMKIIAYGNILSLCLCVPAYYVGYFYFGVMGLAYTLVFPPMICFIYYQYYVSKMFVDPRRNSTL
ncbi:oligosaccharide flippase family protein [Pasteurella skyensis]|uniref:Oligosaccharide flippase family protein n=2 Tax=Phocoenobacter skyensis TaxID=97481 RepID=A0AAJ6NE68_9PAST|nr:oligosaccharide flippase family protein [Pasteurella skyensis]MDP8162129.1 oligosaccharide flippase family protein [Pasteurella skyensis]MDP8170024.1 oligosaccharide flippase family protein [Pasteurella skyensis]MDP8172988.1 oligosaccharide flippase family protein [Pasteurella skyensis]MDP8175105.1 oligosaccharide flippase family protein [Pasteurella skyensis]MDP8179487.1 oligosaccharide flippase family protein [Pasteurella skyensis]